MKRRVDATDRALASLSESLANAAELKGRCYRLRPVDVGRFDLVIEYPRESDQCFDWGGVTVLAVSRDLYAVLVNRVFDIERDGNWRLIVRDGNEKEKS